MRINLNEILARDDYKRMTENLKSVTEEVAEGIRKKMDELDIINNTEFDKVKLDLVTLLYVQIVFVLIVVLHVNFSLLKE